MSSTLRYKGIDIKDFELKNFDGIRLQSKGESEGENGLSIEEHQEREFLEHKKRQKDERVLVIKKELLDSRKNQFDILPLVEHYRGIKEQAKKEHQNKVESDIAEKVSQFKERAYEEGFNKGIQEGICSNQEKLKKEVEAKLEDLAQYIEDVKSEYDDLLLSQRHKIYRLINVLTKWVILRELKNDGKYVERLLEKIILEVNTRSNLLLKVGQDNFEKIPGVLDFFENRFKGIKNTRVEVIHDNSELSKKGMILESDNGILDGTFKTQFKNLDRLLTN